MQLTDHGHSALGKWEGWGGLQGSANEEEGCSSTWWSLPVTQRWFYTLRTSPKPAKPSPRASYSPFTLTTHNPSPDPGFLSFVQMIETHSVSETAGPSGRAAGRPPTRSSCVSPISRSNGLKSGAGPELPLSRPVLKRPDW